MKVKVVDYIAEFFAKNKITDIFMITGGGAMHLNDALGHHPALHCLYNHHEQACAIAAESYARINNTIAAVCVTTGPGGTNAITGVAGGYLDSIPMLIISGQVRYDTTARSTGLNIRAMGDQEFDICKAVECMTKYCEMIVEPAKIRYCLEKALYHATAGRPGPCWLDIPLNVQSAVIETDDLSGYTPDENNGCLPKKPSENTIKLIVDKIKSARRPVLYAGSGIRVSGGHRSFLRVAEKLNIPIVTAWNSIDAISTAYPLYTGRGGIMGDRAGNFAVQNSDLVFSIGCRLSIRQVGYNYKSWARDAFTIIVDVDADELRKPTLHVDMPVHADAKELLEMLDSMLPDEPLFTNKEWAERCRYWKDKYPVVLPRHYENSTDSANVYCFINELSSRLCENATTVVGNGSACVVGSQTFVIKNGQRFIINSAIASMGYDLPASIGACIATGRKEVICITGDGSLQMNLQELQTIIHNKLPIKVFVINNDGYHSIRQTQLHYFGEPLVGIGGDSGDLSFPDLRKIAYAYGYPYFYIRNNSEMNVLDEMLKIDGSAICEVFVSKEQLFEPKAASRQLEDGTMVSAPLEDLAPFLPDDELAENMFIPVIKNNVDM